MTKDKESKIFEIYANKFCKKDVDAGHFEFRLSKMESTGVHARYNIKRRKVYANKKLYEMSRPALYTTISKKITIFRQKTKNKANVYKQLSSLYHEYAHYYSESLDPALESLTHNTYCICNNTRIYYHTTLESIATITTLMMMMHVFPAIPYKAHLACRAYSSIRKMSLSNMQAYSLPYKHIIDKTYEHMSERHREITTKNDSRT